ncbi:MAG: DinB family protein, partial [Terriglobales bacterium]
MPMSETARIADQLRRAFYGVAWHGDSLFKILEGVTAERASAHPVANAHSIWELVLHIAAWDGAARRYMTGVAVKLSGKKNFPPVLDASAAAWSSTLEEVRRVHEELVAAVEKFPEKSLTKAVPGKKGAHYNFYYLLH